MFTLKEAVGAMGVFWIILPSMSFFHYQYHSFIFLECYCKVNLKKRAEHEAYVISDHVHMSFGNSKRHLTVPSLHLIQECLSKCVGIRIWEKGEEKE